MSHNLSLIEKAVQVLIENRKPHDIYELFDIVTKDLLEDEKAELINKFYTDLTTSAKFVYAGNNEWDLKANQKIELWEKDGSFYKEYSVIELPEEYIEAKPAPKAKTKAKPAPVVVKEVKKVIEKEPVVEVITEPEVKPEVTDVVEPVVAPITTTTEENYEEEIFDNYQDFDEEKYNEYMDTYEDQYDD